MIATVETATPNLKKALAEGCLTRKDRLQRRVTQDPARGKERYVSPHQVGINSDLVLDAQKYVAEARRELVEAIQDEELAPALTAKVIELGRAEGELQAFQDAMDFSVRYAQLEVLIRLTESARDPVLVHDVRREGYARAVSHIFRGTGRTPPT